MKLRTYWEDFESEKQNKRVIKGFKYAFASTKESREKKMNEDRAKWKLKIKK